MEGEADGRVRAVLCRRSTPAASFQADTDKNNHTYMVHSDYSPLIQKTVVGVEITNITYSFSTIFTLKFIVMMYLTLVFIPYKDHFRN